MLTKSICLLHMLGDPSDLMNGGKWVTIADITDLGHSKREKKDGQWEMLDGLGHVLRESCARDPVLLQQVLKGSIVNMN